MSTTASSHPSEQDALERLHKVMVAFVDASRGFLDEQRLYQFVCSRLVEAGLFECAWFGHADVSSGKILKMIAHAADSEDFLQELKASLGRPAWDDPSSVALQKGKVIWIKDIDAHSAGQPILSNAVKYGYASVLSIPIISNGKPTGALTLYCADRERIGQTTVSLLTQWVASNQGDFVRRTSAPRQFSDLNEAELRQLLDLIPQHLVLYGAFGRKLYFNRRFLDYLGLPLETLLYGENARQVVHPDDQNRIMGVFVPGFSNGVPFETEVRVRRKDGEFRWFLVQVTPVRDGDGKVIRWCGTSTDIHDRKQAEERSRQEKLALREDIEDRKRAEEIARRNVRDLRLLIDTIPGMVWTASSSGAMETANQLFLDYLGGTFSGIDQQGWIKIVHPDDTELVMRSWLHSVATGDLFNVENRIRRSDSVYRWFHVIARPLRNEDSQIVRWYGLCADIEDAKSAAEALQRIQGQLSRATQVAAVGELAASIAHEINQPLAAVLMDGSACRRWLSAQSPNLIEATRAAERVIRDCNAAAEVVRRIRALFQRAEPEKLPLELNDVVAEVIGLLKGDIVRQSIAVETHLEENLPHILADRVQLQQVIFNLLTNGIQAMEKSDHPKKLHVRSRRQGAEMVLIEVRDHGTGLKDPEKIFEAFFTTKKTGMGMGLAICRSIIDAHGGRLWAAPTNGPGATICFTLPLQASASQ